MVIGLPAPGADDETMCAVVVAGGPGEKATLEELHAALGEAGMTELYWPERLEVVDALPKTPTGKIRKIELRERFAGPLWTGRPDTGPAIFGGVCRYRRRAFV